MSTNETRHVACTPRTLCGGGETMSIAKELTMARMPGTIFLADDDDDMRALLALALQSDGYEVVEAKDGAELLELLAGASASPMNRPDLIVTDVLMPCYSGLGVLAALHKSAWNVPVILITARQDAGVEKDAKRLGAAAVVRKPFDIDDLRTAILNASIDNQLEVG
jgi:two-component system response regulator (stage 0 sporulation protein F)